MVKYKVVVTSMAQDSLHSIVDYLQESASKSVANKVRKGILATIKTLAKLPNTHEVEHDISDKQTIYRRILKWNYRIIFSVNEQTIVVSVVEITHTSQNPNVLISKFKK